MKRKYAVPYQLMSFIVPNVSVILGVAVAITIIQLVLDADVLD